MNAALPPGLARAALRLLALLALAAPALPALGGYVATVSGGAWSSWAPGPSAVLSGLGGNGGSSAETGGDPNVPSSGPAGAGGARCDGAMAAHLRWQGLGPRPPAIVVRETAVAQWSGDPGACDPGLPGAATLYAGPYGEARRAVRYRVVQSPAADLDLPAVSPAASVECTGQPRGGRGGAGATGPGACSVNYAVDVFEVRLVLSGGLMPQTKELLVGQRLTAAVDLGGAPSSPQDAYSWNFSDGSIGGAGGNGSPFATWYVNSYSMPVYVPYASPDPNGSATQVTFRTPDTVRVRCGVSLAIGVSFTLEDYVQAVGPEITRHEVVVGEVSLRSEGAKYRLSPDGVSLANPSLGPYGMLYRLDLKTPDNYVDLYQDDGRWNSTQIVTGVSHRFTDSGVGYHWSINGQTGLDGTYPYLGPWHANGSPHTHSDRPMTEFDQASQVSWVSLDDSFKTYVLYIPPGLFSSYVPVRRVDWHVAGTASRYIQWVSTPVANSWSGPQSYAPHPDWYQVLNNSANFEPD